MPAPRQQQVAPTMVGNSDETYKNRRKKESGEEPSYATRAPIQHSYVTSPDYTCQCTPGEKRHPVTGVCLRNECLRKEDNDCDRNAQCIDTDESYYCVCLPGFLDNSPDRVGNFCWKIKRNSLGLQTRPCLLRATKRMPNGHPPLFTECNLLRHPRGLCVPLQTRLC